jgi:hypothetical protein
MSALTDGHGIAMGQCSPSSPNSSEVDTVLSGHCFCVGKPHEEDHQMSDQATMQSQQAVQPSHSGAAHGFAVFAGVIMIMSGAFQAIAGLVGLFANEFYVATRNYVFQFDVTTWGVIHLVLGALLILAGFSVFSGRTWARVLGIILTGLSALGNFMFIPYYPFWSLLIIALDVLVIWALAVYHPKS